MYIYIYSEGENTLRCLLQIFGYILIRSRFHTSPVQTNQLIRALAKTATTCRARLDNSQATRPHLLLQMLDQHACS